MNQIERLGIGDEMILFDYFVADEEVARFFSVSDLVVQPYRSATQSGVTQVAYFFDVPMVVTGVGGLREIVPDGEVGFVVDRRPSPGRSTVTTPKTCPKNSGRTSAATKSGSPGNGWPKIFKSFTGRSAKTRKKPGKPEKPDKNNKFAKTCFPERDPGTPKNLKCISPLPEISGAERPR